MVELNRKPRYVSNNNYHEMDALKAEIAAKRKALGDEPLGTTRVTKYIRRGELERLKEEEESQIKQTRQEEKAQATVASVKSVRPILAMP